MRQSVNNKNASLESLKSPDLSFLNFLRTLENNNVRVCTFDLIIPDEQSCNQYVSEREKNNISTRELFKGHSKLKFINKVSLIAN